MARKNKKSTKSHKSVPAVPTTSTESAKQSIKMGKKKANSTEFRNKSESAVQTAGAQTASQGTNIGDSSAILKTEPDQSQNSDISSQTPQASSSNPVPPLANTQPTLVPDHVFTSSISEAYNRDWMVLHGIDVAILQGFSSKTQFRTLVSNGVIKLGDRLRVTFHSGNGAVHKEGTITEGPNKWRPDIKIAVSRPGVDFITLHGCAGPVDFVNTMSNEFGAADGHDISVRGSWGAINLITSGGRDMGTLWKVRQAYHLWVEEKDKWAVRNNRPKANHQKSTNARPATYVPKRRKPKTE